MSYTTLWLAKSVPLGYLEYCRCPRWCSGWLRVLCCPYRCFWGGLRVLQLPASVLLGAQCDLFLVHTKMRWCIPCIIWDPRHLLGIKVPSCPIRDPRCNATMIPQETLAADVTHCEDPLSLWLGYVVGDRHKGCFYTFTSTCTGTMLFAMFLVFLGLPQSQYPILHPPSLGHCCPLLHNMAMLVNNDMLGMLTALLRATWNMHVVHGGGGGPWFRTPTIPPK